MTHWLVPLAAALQVSVDDLLRAEDDDDVVIRPTQRTDGARTTWALNRVDGRTMAMKMRLEPVPEISAPRVHPGFDWFLVIEGRVLLQLGDPRIEVTQGEAAEFSTMTPHAISAIDDPAELVMVFDREGQRAHLHR
ncbi:cupin domain-containing protein [Microbacterium sp. UBA837]|uniref:cupin domain-containing protein n=1 Tax=Microbacterium sp. UBA837 TaxID=1946956 RepID=UPI0025CC8E88|nr:cupin domain-containing protein [Microbacterium sp. UBA837]|tara:strand:+ start:5650 stop:6057 length:408 start_codon:yes stop_codon:yes gene_type:complete